MIEITVTRKGEAPTTRRFEGTEVLFGRAENVQFSIADPYISRTHGRFFYKTGQLYFEDMMSHNGSKVIRGDGTKVHLKGPDRPAQAITPEDQVIIGELTFSGRVQWATDTTGWTMTGSIPIGDRTMAESMKKSTTTFKMLHKFGLLSISTHRLEDVLKNLAEACTRLFSPVGYMSFWDITLGEDAVTTWDTDGQQVEPRGLGNNRPIVEAAIYRKEGYILHESAMTPIPEEDLEDNASVMAVPLWITEEAPWGVFVINRKPHDEFYSMKDLRLLSIFAFHASITAQRIRLVQDLEEAFETTMGVVVEALDLRDAVTSGHSLKVQALSMEIANEMKLSDHSKKLIRYASLVHDAGKLGVADDILMKKDALSDSERIQIEQHASLTQSLISKIKFPKHLEGIPQIAAMHHEKLDGSGPMGLAGDEIPVESRVIAVADIFEALTASRPYKDAKRASKARSMMEKMAGKELDEEVVNALFRALSLAT